MTGEEYLKMLMELRKQESDLRNMIAVYDKDTFHIYLVEYYIDTDITPPESMQEPYKEYNEVTECNLCTLASKLDCYVLYIIVDTKMVKTVEIPVWSFAHC